MRKAVACRLEFSVFRVVALCVLVLFTVFKGA